MGICVQSPVGLVRRPPTPRKLSLVRCPPSSKKQKWPLEGAAEVAGGEDGRQVRGGPEGQAVWNFLGVQERGGRTRSSWGAREVWRAFDGKFPDEKPEVSGDLGLKGAEAGWNREPPAWSRGPGRIFLLPREPPRRA